jgi:AcrR family transcriptional regulator
VGEQVERDDEPGRRERKKRETREALVDAAMDLFAEQGVDGTTIEQISDRVDVSERTFYRYFATKEDALFADSIERRERFAAALATRPEDEPLLDGVRAAARDLLAVVLARPEQGLRRQRLIHSSDALHARHLRTMEEWAALVAEHVARRLRMRADEALPRLLGWTVIAAVRTALGRWVDDPTLDIGAEVDRCFELLGHLGEASETKPGANRR